MRPKRPIRAPWSIVGAIALVLGGCAASSNPVASPAAVVSAMPTLVASTAPSPTNGRVLFVGGIASDSSVNDGGVIISSHLTTFE